ncbi:membrane protein DedA with SNARE-associated domain [Rhodoligotrophos appendicifer]|uniref:DedA family protein n=1 Tax=Rhodoligotrophos appendicifer TaxID=987056 RepID=UPI00117BE9E5|nr:DedA family protein [Rhodoligotrophos appendicifer]
MHHDLSPFIQSYGDLAVFMAIFLEAFGLPLPGEIMLITGGGLAARGEINPVLFFVSAWVAAVLGDNIGYVIGRLLGRTTIIRYGSKIGITAPRYEWAEEKFNRFGPVIVAGARFVAILRQINGIVAGSLGMHWLTFMIFNAIGAALWVGLWGSAAFFLGSHLQIFLHIAKHLGTVGAIVLAILVAAGLWWHFKRPINPKA